MYCGIKGTTVLLTHPIFVDRKVKQCKKIFINIYNHSKILEMENLKQFLNINKVFFNLFIQFIAKVFPPEGFFCNLSDFWNR